MELTPQQQKTIARIIDRHTGWMVGWAASERSQQESYAKAAKAVAAYIKRLSSKSASHE